MRRRAMARPQHQGSGASALALVVAALALSASCAASALSATKQACEGRRIYTHTLDRKFNSDLLYDKERDEALPKDWYVDYMLNHLERASLNDGFGVQQQENMGVPGLEGAWYDTDQNSLGILFHARMQTYPCRVARYEDADLVYVPYFGGLDLLRTMHQSVHHRDRLALQIVPWLTSHPAWKRRNGTDHFWVMGRNVWDFLRFPKTRSWGSQLLRMEAMVNTIWTVVVETIQNDEMARVVSAPKPTAFHPWKKAQVQLWQDHVRTQNRTWLFSFAGGKRASNTLEGQMRSKVFWQCQGSHYCGLVDCTEFKKCETLRQFFELYLDSTFCLHPVGDACTRRSVLDGMLAGCIPVVFKSCTLAEQFQWHLNPDEIGEFFVYIDHKTLRGQDAGSQGVLIEKVLRAIPPQKVEEMRNRVIGLIPHIIYGGVQKNGTIDSPDFLDSVDFLIDGLVSHAGKPGQSQ